jgi:hypothetical protein
LLFEINAKPPAVGVPPGPAIVGINSKLFYQQNNYLTRFMSDEYTGRVSYEVLCSLSAFQPVSMSNVL